MDNNQLRRLAGLPPLKKQALTEEYKESSDFDADMDKALKLLNDALLIIKSTSWKKHMHDTDYTFGTEGKGRSSDIEEQLSATITSLDKLYHHFIEDAS